jgi:hypothetical protein
MNLISYGDQVYLVYYWLRTNLIDFIPTLENIEKEVYDEFDITDRAAIKEIYDLFNNN